jgi:CheY-like chemotaxis protein
MVSYVHSTHAMSAGCGKILVVEDDGVERESLVELLRLWGYEVSAASDGWQALQKITSASFDLILSDAHMPRMSGIGLLHELRREFRFLSCVIMSGQESELEESEAMRLGARRFLKKPIDPEELKAELSKCLMQGQENEPARRTFQTTPPLARSRKKEVLWSHLWRKH